MAPRRKALGNINVNTPITPRREVNVLKSQLDKSDAEMETLKSQLAELTASQEAMTEKHNAEIAELTAGLSNTKIEQASARTTVEPVVNPFGGSIPTVSKSAPKRPMSAYQYYCQTFRDAAKGKTPNGTLGEISAMLGQMWQNSSPATKETYSAMAEGDRSRYAAEMEAYKSEMERVETEKAALDMYYREKKQKEMEAFYEEHYAEYAAKNSKTTSSAPSLPKQPRSAYNFYVKVRREQMEKKKADIPPFHDFTKQLAEEWSAIQRSKKKADKTMLKKCRDMADIDRDRFTAEQEELAAAKAKEAEEEAAKFEEIKQEALRLHAEKTREALKLKAFEEQQKEEAKAAKLEKKKEREEKKVEKEAEKEAKKAEKEAKKAEKEAKALMPKRGRSAYIFFSMEQRSTVVEELGEASPKSVVSELGSRWRALSDDERAPYVEEANKDKLRYETEMAAFSGPSL